MAGIRCVTSIVAELGEGPVWSPRDNALYWIDVYAPAVHRWQPDDDQVRSWPVSGLIGSLAVRASGGLLVSLVHGIHALDLDTGAVTLVVDPEVDHPQNRYNDATVDPSGRLWVGSMRLDEAGTDASLYVIHSDRSWERKVFDVGLSNGIGFSPDQTVMYYTDSLAREIWAFDFDAESAAISNRRVFAADAHCSPDGLTIDAEGYVWSAKWNGWRVVRYAPDGRVDRVVELPVQCPTSVAFGGAGLGQLFITSARRGLRASALERGPLAGRLLVLDEPGVTGQAEAEAQV